jgi:hypothetical protein
MNPEQFNPYLYSDFLQKSGNLVLDNIAGELITFKLRIAKANLVTDLDVKRHYMLDLMNDFKFINCAKIHICEINGHKQYSYDDDLNPIDLTQHAPQQDLHELMAEHLDNEQPSTSAPTKRKRNIKTTPRKAFKNVTVTKPYQQVVKFMNPTFDPEEVNPTDGETKIWTLCNKLPNFANMKTSMNDHADKLDCYLLTANYDRMPALRDALWLFRPYIKEIFRDETRDQLKQPDNVLQHIYCVPILSKPIASIKYNNSIIEEFRAKAIEMPKHKNMLTKAREEYKASAKHLQRDAKIKITWRCEGLWAQIIFVDKGTLEPLNHRGRFVEQTTQVLKDPFAYLMYMVTNRNNTYIGSSTGIQCKALKLCYCTLQLKNAYFPAPPMPEVTSTTHMQNEMFDFSNLSGNESDTTEEADNVDLNMFQ